MSEGNHSTPVASNLSSRLKTFGGNKTALFIAAIGVAILSAGMLMQIFRSTPTEAAPADASKAGKSRVAAGTGKGMARVGNQTITYEQLAAECVERYGEETLEKLINRTIIHQACQDRGIQISETEVKQEVQNIAQKFKLDTSTWYQMLQAERNLTPIQYQRDIIWPMLALRKIAGEEVRITNDDRRKAYERDYGPRVEAKMIMLDNLRRAEECWHKATQADPSTGKPEDFSRLAREYSIEPTSRALGGDIPPIRMHVGSQEVIKEAFKLQPNEVSGIIQAGPSRYVILLCEGFTKQVASYQEVRDIIEENLTEEKRQEAVAKVFEQLKKEIRVDNYVTQTTSGGVRQAGSNKTSSVSTGGEVVPTSATRPSKTDSVRSPYKKR